MKEFLICAYTILIVFIGIALFQFYLFVLTVWLGLDRNETVMQASVVLVLTTALIYSLLQLTYTDEKKEDA